MVAAGVCFFPTIFSPSFRHDPPSQALKWNSGRVPSIARPPCAVSIDRVPGALVTVAKKEEKQQRKSSWKEYFEQAKELIISDGGPPRWFSPLECGSHLGNSPLMLFLPEIGEKGYGGVSGNANSTSFFLWQSSEVDDAVCEFNLTIPIPNFTGIDGMGLGLVSNHHKLGRVFDLWCLHIPIADRTPFTDLVKLVEETVRSEFQRSPNRPIYLVGESLGGCLALAVAARNRDIDLVLILANPATSFNTSLVQHLTPLLDALPGSLFPAVLNILSLIAGHPLRMVLESAVKGLPLLNAFSSSLPVLADILPKETLLWKLKMLKSASAYADSHLNSIKAQTLILCSGKDHLFPSQQEGKRLLQLLLKCELRKFDDSGHFLFLEHNTDLLTVIKRTSYYRHGKQHDYASDFIPPTPYEAKKVLESYSVFDIGTSSVMLSSLEDGKIVKGLAGIPSKGPVLFVGNHMMIACDAAPLLYRFFTEQDIVVRGMAHPGFFKRQKKGKLPEISFFDNFRVMGVVPVGPSNLYQLLSSKSHVLLFPGGIREAFHRKGEEYKLFWPEKSEFVRMAARFGAKIIPFGSVGEDDLGHIVLDYDDLVKIPYFRSEIESFTNEAVQLRVDVDGEVANQQLYIPGILPKVPGRFYYYFGKPIETEGRKQELMDKVKAQELYLEVKSEVERCIAYLKKKRESDPYRSILSRLLYQATHGPTSDIPIFEI